MGCMAGRLPDCLESYSDNNEQIESIKKIKDCYRQVLTPYKIRDSISPIISISRVTTIPLPFHSDLLLLKDFPVFSHSTPELLSSAYYIFSQFSLDPMKLSSFLDIVSKNYYQNIPFHNFRHAFSVLHTVFVISSRNRNLESYMSNQDYLYTLLSAITHDICHPGLNNSYLIACKHELAIQYENKSVLEHHHASTALALIEASDLLGEVDKSYLKEIVFSAILSTDIARHKEVCSSFTEAFSLYDKSKKSHRQAFINYLLHCADIGNQTQCFSLAAVWSLKIVQEFNQQVACEELCGIAVSEYMRIGNDIEKIKKSQYGFIDFIVLPLWKGLTDVLLNCEDFKREVEKNRDFWVSLKDFDFKNI